MRGPAVLRLVSSEGDPNRQPQKRLLAPFFRNQGVLGLSHSTRAGTITVNMDEFVPTVHHIINASQLARGHPV